MNEATLALNERLGISKTRHLSADGKTRLNVMSDEDFRIKLAVDKALADRGISTNQPGELAAKILLGVLAIAGIVFVLGLCVLLRSGSPWYGYRRYYYW